MNTKTLVRTGMQYVVTGFVVVALIVSAFFVMPVQRAHAAGLTAAQISAILGMLSAFNVPAATIANVKAILQKSK